MKPFVVITTLFAVALSRCLEYETLKFTVKIVNECLTLYLFFVYQLYHRQEQEQEQVYVAVNMNKIVTFGAAQAAWKIYIKNTPSFLAY